MFSTDVNEMENTLLCLLKLTQDKSDEGLTKTKEEANDASEEAEDVCEELGEQSLRTASV